MLTGMWRKKSSVTLTPGEVEHLFTKILNKNIFPTFSLWLDSKPRPYNNEVSHRDIFLLCSRIHFKWISLCYCTPLGAKTILSQSHFVRWLLPLYFLIWFFDPDQPYIYTVLACHFDMNKLLRKPDSVQTTRLVIIEARVLPLCYPSKLKCVECWSSSQILEEAGKSCQGKTLQATLALVTKNVQEWLYVSILWNLFFFVTEIS